MMIRFIFLRINFTSEYTKDTIENSLKSNQMWLTVNTLEHSQFLWPFLNVSWSLLSNYHSRQFFPKICKQSIRIIILQIFPGFRQFFCCIYKLLFRITVLHVLVPDTSLQLFKLLSGQLFCKLSLLEHVIRVAWPKHVMPEE